MNLEILSDLSEIIQYSIADFPLFVGIGYLKSQNQYTVGCHFHSDFEFNLVLEGKMDYFINGESVHLNEGDGIFVNSHRLHYNFSKYKTPTKYLVITISPKLFPASLTSVSTMLFEICDIGCTDYVVLHKEECNHIFDYYFKLLVAMQSSKKDLTSMLSYVFSLCSMIFPKIEKDVHTESHDMDWLCLHKMTNYIHENFRDAVSLTEISTVGKVCRSKCCQLFKQYLGQSPIDYLICYRLRKSQELLKSTECSIGEVAEKCGFGGQSYFTEQFKKLYGTTPREYRHSLE